MRCALAFVLLLSLVACDSFREGDAYDLSFYDLEGSFVARLEVEEPKPTECEGLYCNESEWRLVEGGADNGVTLGRRSGDLNAAKTDEGWDLNLLSGIADGGTGARIDIGSDGRVAGTWTRGTIAGPLPGGTVTGIVR